MIMITKHQKEFNTIRWVLQAICKDKLRANLCFLYVCHKNNELVCTNGKCMHIAPNTLKLIPGFFSVIGNKANEVILNPSNFKGEYPNYRMLYPDSVPIHGVTNEQYTHVGFREVKRRADKALEHRTVSFIMCRLIQAYKDPVSFDFDFIKSALMYDIISIAQLHNHVISESDADIVEYGNPNPSSPIYFTGENGHKAVVMPMRA